MRSVLVPAPASTDAPGAWLWLAWILAFVVIELALYWRHGTAGTFSALVWRWLDVGPGGERYRRVRWALLALAFLVLGWHLLAGGW